MEEFLKFLVEIFVSNSDQHDEHYLQLIWAGHNSKMQSYSKK